MNFRASLMVSFLLCILTINTQLGAQEEQELPTDSAISEKLQNNQTLEQLLAITENDSQVRNVINNQIEEKI